MAKRKSVTKPQPRDYYGLAVQYARDVTEGRIIAGRLVTKRAQTFLDELQRDDWDFVFDKQKATRVCAFIEALPLPDQANDARFKLQPFQVFIVANIFGWVHRDTGLRRFIQANIWVAAGAGKSALASAIGLYMAFGDGQRASEVCCVAASKQQSRIVFDTSKQMMSFGQELADFLGVEVNANAIVQEKTGSKFEPRSSEAKTLAGMRPYLAIVDELHVVDEQVYNFVVNRLAKRDQSLLLTISTAGDDLKSVGYAVFERSVRIIEGTEKAPEVFAIVYQADKHDDLLDENEWAKAQPNLDISVRRNVLRSKATEATNQTRFRYAFLTEQLNVWVNAKDAWLSIDKWDVLTDESLSLSDFEGRDCYIGVDLALRRDLCSKVYVFPDTDAEGNTVYTVFQRSYLPEAQVNTKPEYMAWSHDGFLEVTPGDITDLAKFEQDLKDDAQRFRVQELCFDIAHAGLVVQNLEAEGLTVVNVPQRTLGLSQPMKDAEEAILQGRLRHSGDPLFRWTVANVVQFISPNGNVFPEKSDPANKIDPAVAMITAFNRAPSWSGNTGPLRFRTLGG